MILFRRRPYANISKSEGWTLCAWPGYEIPALNEQFTSEETMKNISNLLLDALVVFGAGVGAIVILDFLGVPIEGIWHLLSYILPK